MKAITGGAKYFKYAECNEGDVLVKKGKYAETIEGKFGLVHYFDELTTKERIGLNSSGSLNSKLDRITEGEVVKIIYQGMVTIKKGKFEGKDAHQFDVLVYDKNDLSSDDDEEEVEEEEEGELPKAAKKVEAKVKAPVKKSTVKRPSPLDALE